MSANRANLSWTLCTPIPVRGAIAAIQIRGTGPQLDTLLDSLGAGALATGQLAVRRVGGIDACVVARFEEQSVFVFPHAGKRILELLAAELDRQGVRRAGCGDPLALFPEAADEVEARMLVALAAAASPLAIDVLLDQPRRWRELDRIGEVDRATANALACLLRPPLVVAIGPPNVGKSSLLNALAGRSISVVADLPGTTRDHVGAALDLGGLAVRWVDCPGFGGAELDELEAESQRLALEMAAAADLLVICHDPTTYPLELGDIGASKPVLEVALRADLGLPRHWLGRGPVVSVRAKTGLGDLVDAIRERLVPAAAFADVRAWRFWDVPGGLFGSM